MSKRPDRSTKSANDGALKDAGPPGAGSTGGSSGGSNPGPGKSADAGEARGLPDPAQTAKVLADVAERSARLIQDYMARQANKPAEAPSDEFGIARAFMELSARMLANPWKVAEAQMAMFWDYTNLWQQSMLRLAGLKADTVAQPVRGDNRFRDNEWQDNFLFDYVKQSYLIAGRHIQDAVGGVEGLTPEAQRKVAFFTRQYVDALSPSNFAMTNPQVLRETLASGGQNLVNGLSNLLDDIERGHISMTDEKAFKVGQNVATSPGKVVFQNELMQLIQYAPSTTEVFRQPLLIIPPWINKFYILDLREKNSFIRWAVSQGHTVFVISWVNPDERHAGKDFEDYMQEGPVAAMQAIERATGEHDINVIGYCLGGTLLGSTLAWLKSQGASTGGRGKGKARAAGALPVAQSATFFVSLLDFSIPGELGVFIDEQQVANLEKRMNARGYLEGSEMAGTFNLLRANDLVWSFVINNYLMGKEPFPFDLLYWNSDSTRMPAKMHAFYLRNMYLRNALAEPGGITLAGVPIDLGRVDTPAYFISTAEDHIAPWKSTYRGAQRLAGPVRFVLGGSGHIAGIVNPPAAGKYGYWVADTAASGAALPGSAEDWQGAAAQHEGSWWNDWQAWIAGLNGQDCIPARVPGEGGLPALEDAPGSYVSVRLGARVKGDRSSSARKGGERKTGGKQ
jgi:polyhydroxyalkanoate synthase